MDTETFLGALRTAIDLDAKLPLTMEMNLDVIPGWDSLAMVSFMSALDIDYDIIISAQKIRGCVTVSDLFKATQLP